MTDNTNHGEEPKFEFTRRTFMEQTGVTGSAAMLAEVTLASEAVRGLGEDEEWQPTEELPGVDEEALVELDVDEARVVQAMAARIMPSDEFGPGAVDAGVVYFIDRQLAGAWGFGENFYLEPPFRNRYDGAKPNQGYQSRLTPQEVYRFAIDWINDYAERQYGAEFIDLSPEEQDQVLMDVESNEPNNFRSIEPEEFFQLLRQNTLEGMYCDPAYEGNRDMVGWKMKEFPGSPGALGTYRDLIQEDEFLNLAPRSVEDDVEAVGIETGILPEEAGAADGNESDGGQSSATPTATGDEATETAQANHGSHAHGGGDGHGDKHGEDVELPDDGETGESVPGHGPRWALVDEEAVDDEQADVANNEDVSRSPADRSNEGEDR